LPELPEVETIVRTLRQQPALRPGERFSRAEVLWARSLAEPGVEEFLTRLPGQQIGEIGRRSKFIRFNLNRDTLLFHLRMSGDLRVEPSDAPVQPHDRLRLHLENRHCLVFNDARKFGRLWLTAEPESVLGRLGPEPLGEDFHAEDLFTRLQAVRRQLKPLLLDQSFLAGMGNIYTDEALHQVTREQAARLWAAIRGVLEEGIRRNGASIDWVYRGGSFQNNFRAYQRTGQPCPVCGTAIQRILVGQRGTHFCPQCQPEFFPS
jgi:formamidopyrimidine-DNA glycosylase